MRSFHDWQARSSASLISASPVLRFSADRSAKMLVMARDFLSSFVRALRSPPDSGMGWCLRAIWHQSVPPRLAQPPNMVRSQWPPNSCPSGPAPLEDRGRGEYIGKDGFAPHTPLQAAVRAPPMGRKRRHAATRSFRCSHRTARLCCLAAWQTRAACLSCRCRLTSFSSRRTIHGLRGRCPSPDTRRRCGRLANSSGAPMMIS